MNNLDVGSSLLPDLTELLLRFRVYAVGLQADVQKPFFMIGVKEVDHSYLRFVWRQQEREIEVWRL